MQNQVKKRTLENIFFMILLFAGGLVYYGSSKVNIFVTEPLTAKTYGQVVSGVLVVVTAIKIVLDFINHRKQAKADMVVFSEGYRLILVGVILMIYCYGIGYVGYFTSTLLFLLIMLLILSEVRNVKVVAFYSFFSLGFCIFLYNLFVVMKVFLPNTPLI